MGKIAFTLCTALLVFCAWEYIRILQVEKDVVFHHFDRCSAIDHGAKVMDLTRFGDLTIGIADDWEGIAQNGVVGAPNGHLFTVSGLKRGKIQSKVVPISNFPSGVPFHPRGFYLFENSTLYILNSIYSQKLPIHTRIELLNITDTADGLQATYYRSLNLPRYLEGRVADLIVTAHWELYLAQNSARKDEGDGSLWSRAAELADEVVGSQTAYVHRCTFQLDAAVSCKALNNTAAVRVTGISKDKFGSFFVAYSSLDQNSIGVYDRNDKTGDFELRHTVPIRDRAQKIEWDEGWQRTYGGALPYPYQLSSAPAAGGIIEMKAWDFRGGYVYRSLTMQRGDLLNGASCATRQGDFFLYGSHADTKLVLCEIASPGN